MTNTSTSGQYADDVTAVDAESPHVGEANLSERDMVQRLTSGDRQALDALLTAARPRLAAIALKVVRNPDDAEDVVQEAMLKVWRYVGRFEGRAALSTWLHRIVVNTGLDYLRSRRQGAVVPRRADDSPDDEARAPEAIVDETPEDLLASAQVTAVVREGISQLSPVHRQVLALRELEGESYQSIADIARCPVGTVMSRLHHARHRLAETLAPQTADLLIAQAA